MCVTNILNIFLNASAHAVPAQQIALKVFYESAAQCVPLDQKRVGYLIFSAWIRL